VSIEHGSGVNGLPGYGATMQLVQGTPGGHMFKPAWSKLELFTLAAALDFLRPKLKQALERKDPDALEDAVVEITLGFAIMAVFADRENTAYIEEMAQRAKATAEGQAIESEIEEEEINPPQGIQW
jgi:hypothetical protein